MLPDLGVEGDCGVLHTNEQLMSLRDQDDPNVMIWKEKGEVEWETWIKDDIDSDIDGGHISHDLASTWI